MFSQDPSNPSSILLEATDYVQNEYWANNFNDTLSGMNVIFKSLIHNNWPIMENALLEVTMMYSLRKILVVTLGILM